MGVLLCGETLLDPSHDRVQQTRRGVLRRCLGIDSYETTAWDNACTSSLYPAMPEIGRSFDVYDVG